MVSLILVYIFLLYFVIVKVWSNYGDYEDGSYFFFCLDWEIDLGGYGIGVFKVSIC